uniref:Uncharacterized protein n=1 Tax=Eutreptiella gymnastica TaxID=73025 RepID=A0A7S1I9D2_9EUGL
MPDRDNPMPNRDIPMPDQDIPMPDRASPTAQMPSRAIAGPTGDCMADAARSPAAPPLHARSAPPDPFPPLAGQLVALRRGPQQVCGRS